ncbi:hypothetical protein QTG54_015395 [Skeletonema marinoi]|uniref:Bifunctional lysine-specific demethylase and histidyl-hydroxylase n=1 Tax=Skeletonema marinoi TaxID=267567 RepID=A0AAD8XUG7_9STRA|nr:hypothetical protein QTG54_015395 [Skeletonema marinoi]
MVDSRQDRAKAFFYKLLGTTMKSASTIVAIVASAASVAAFISPSCRSHENQTPSSAVSMSGSVSTLADAPAAIAAAVATDDESKIFDDADDDMIEFVCNDIGAELREQQAELQLPSDYDTKEDDILASLFGSNEIRNDFFRNIFGHRVAYFPSNRHRLLKPPMSGFDLSSLYDTNEWISLRKRGSQDMLDKEQTSYDDLTEYIAGGGSAIIPVIPGDYLHDTKEQIDHALGVEGEYGTSMNVYHSGPSAVALNIHYDSYPVIVLQLQGEKEWIIQNDNFGQNINDITDWRNVTLTAGDLLYIPKGVHHAATGDPEHGSTHATIGLP